MTWLKCWQVWLTASEWLVLLPRYIITSSKIVPLSLLIFCPWVQYFDESAEASLWTGRHPRPWQCEIFPRGVGVAREIPAACPCPRAHHCMVAVTTWTSRPANISQKIPGQITSLRRSCQASTHIVPALRAGALSAPPIALLGTVATF